MNELLIDVAQDLAAIQRMIPSLHARAIDLANAKTMPGGQAMINLAPVADLDIWDYRNEQSGHALAADEDDDLHWPPTQILIDWANRWRKSRNHLQPDRKKTLTTEVGYLANPDTLAWARSQPYFHIFTVDVRRARTRFETILRDGEPPDRIRVICDKCPFDRKKPNRTRLITVYATTPADDWWKCPLCKRPFTQDDVNRALRHQLRLGNAATWVRYTLARSILKPLGVSKTQLDGWIDAGITTRYTHRRELWWPDVWTRFLDWRIETHHTISKPGA